MPSKSAAATANKSRSAKGATARKSGGAKPRGAKRAAAKSKFTKDELVGYYRDMLLIRRFEERAGQLYGMGLIGGFCHLYIGQEAVVTGMQAVARPQDTFITSYRDHGQMIASGMDPNGVMAELTGRIDGYSRGKGGSMHMFSPETGFYGGHGIVGGQVPLGTGLAFAHKYDEDGGVCFCYFGDGAVNQGQVYEAFNMAALWDLPIVYVIENNRYAMGTALHRASSKTELYQRGMAHGIEGFQANGMDVREVKIAADKAVAHCRAGKGPIIIEMMTYRYRGHSMSDPAKYRSKEEVQKVRDEQDAINTLKEVLLSQKMTDEATLKEIDKEVKAIVAEAARFAQESPEPDPSELYTDVLS